MSVAITGLYAGILGLLLIVLSFRIVQRRMKFKIGVGTGNNPELERAVRVHGNFIEYVPFVLLLIGILESGGAPAWAVHAAGITLVVARLLHAVGLTTSAGRTPGRFIGTLATWLLIAVLGISNIARYVA